MFFEKFHKKEIFILVNILLLILNINTDPIFMTSDYFLNSGFLGVTKFLRSITPYIILVNFLIYFALGYKKNINKISTIYWLFIFYCFFQLIGLLFSDNEFLNLVWICSFFFTIILFSDDEYYLIERKYFLIVFIFLIIFFIFFSPSLYKYFTTVYNFHNYYPDSFFPHVDEIVNNKNDQLSIHTIVAGESPPRSSGMSRLALILIIFFIFYDLKKEHFLKKILIIFLCIAIFLYQSRIVLASYLLILFLILIHNFQFKDFLKKISTYLLIPLLFSLITFSYKEKIISKNLKNNIELINPDLVYNETIRSFKNHDDFSSGRFEIWKKILNHEDMNFLIGLGPQADRYLINQSASNALIYSLASSGVFGIIFIIGVYFYFLKKFLFYYFLNKQEIKKKWHIYSSIYMMFFILTRSLVETTFAVFSIDLIICLICISILENDKNFNN